MDVIVLGASARAAAFSAHRAGLRPWCVDLFADADLSRRFPTRKVPFEDYPHGLLRALRDAPQGPVIYTGGLENYPALIAQIDRPLWGNPPSVLRRVRSPFLLNDVLRRHGLPTMLVRADPPSAGDPRRWLLKPLRGSGGVGIRHYIGRTFFDPRSHYVQEHCPGPCLGAAYFAPPGGADPILLGVASMYRSGWLHAPPFCYAGSVLAQFPTGSSLSRVAKVVADEFGLRGLFGVDVVRRTDPSSGKQDFPVLEVNPRYTASMELIERARGWPLLAMQQAAFDEKTATAQPVANSAASCGPLPATVCMGKAILYARDRFVFPAAGPWCAALDVDPDDAEFADIPHAGESIARGRPVMTVFASAACESECSRKLREAVQALDRCLWG